MTNRSKNKHWKYSEENHDTRKDDFDMDTVHFTDIIVSDGIVNIPY